MSSDPPIPNPLISRLEEGRMFALDTANSQWVALSADSDGNLQASQINTSGNKVDPATEQTLQTIADAASTNANDKLRIDTPSPIDVSAAEVDVDLATQSLATLTVTDDGSLNINSISSELDVDLNTQSLSALTVTDDGSLNVAGTVATEQQTPVAIEDSTGTAIDPARASDFPDTQVSGEDIIANGDLVVGPVPVARTSGVTIAANSTDGNTFSVSVEWTDASGNIYQQESATDLELSAVTQDFARLIRKAPQATVTVTDESGATQNNINIHVGAQR